MGDMQVPAAATGPDNAWSSSMPPSPGQWEQIARLALSLLQAGHPDTRAEAQIMVARLVLAINDPEHQAPAVPEPDRF